MSKTRPGPARPRLPSAMSSPQACQHAQHAEGLPRAIGPGRRTHSQIRTAISYTAVQLPLIGMSVCIPAPTHGAPSRGRFGPW
jgi:hypothetical protein